MVKSDYKFHKDRKKQIQNLSKTNEPNFWDMHTPIFIPKKKKFKRS